MLSSQKNIGSVPKNSKQRFMTPLGTKSYVSNNEKMYTTAGPQLRIEDDQAMSEYSSYNIPTKETNGKKNSSNNRFNQSPKIFKNTNQVKSNAFLGKHDPL